ncbi:MAG: 16S rRNA pseudouridine(516) synthase RsuA [Pseudomonadota bacterium]
MRLDRYLSSVTDLSRSLARNAIRDGRVLVDGELRTQPAMNVAETAEVQLDAETVSHPGHCYFMMNKPQGYVCATEDRQHSTLLDLLNEPVTSGLHFVGRLDIDTTGLVLITDDGAWSHRITAPARTCPKDYLVELAEPLPEQAAERLRQGVLLRNEKKPTAPAQLEYLTPRRVRLTLSEGRYHQVKRMIAAVGNRVIGLRRERIGGLELDRSLAPGEYRPLTQLERVAVFTDSGESREREPRSVPLTSANRV